MSETFAELFEHSVKQAQTKIGAILNGKVVGMNDDSVIIDVGLKSESYLPRRQFLDDNGVLEISVGDEVEVALEAIEDGRGETRLSRERAKRMREWNDLIVAYENAQNVTGMITNRVKGGFTVEIKSIRAFLPGSLVDVKPIKDLSNLEGKTLEFKVIKVDKKRNNVVVSRKSVMESENSAEREALISTIQEGQEIKGVIKNLTDYGAFVDLGGIDGLLHITDMSWKRIKHPSEIVAVGDECTVKVLKFDKEKNRVSLGLKQLGGDPWVNIKQRYPEGMKLNGKVTNITDYGCFVEIEDGVEGLVHVSEMDWTNKNIHPSKVVQLGNAVEVVVLDIDEERRRISLGIKQCQANPWAEFANKHSRGERVVGKIKSITDFGIFVGLDGDIDGLIHLSDLSWDETGEEAVRKYKKGQDIEVMILSIDADRERVSLGIKQLEKDPFMVYIESHNKGSNVTGKVISIDGKRVVLCLDDCVDGFIDLSEFKEEPSKGLEVQAIITDIDEDNKAIFLTTSGSGSS